MSEKHQKIQDLFREHCRELPSDDYFERFLDEFHGRQRGEMLKTSSRGLFFERVRTWFSELAVPKWAFGAGLGAAYASVMAAVLFWPSSGEESEAMSAPNIVPASSEVHFSELPVIEVDFAKKSEGNVEQGRRIEF